MREFSALYKFNFRRMINTWMIRVLAIVVMTCMLAGIIYVHSINQKKSIGVDITGDEINTEYIISALNSSSASREYTLKSAGGVYEGEVEISVAHLDEGVKLGILSSGDDLTTNQLEYLKKSIETEIMQEEGYEYPTVIVEQIKEEMSFAEEIAFYIIAFVLYLFILLCGSIITSSVALEKTSRVSELIVYRVSVLKLIYSKVLALYSIIIMILAGVAAEFGIAIGIKWIDISSVQSLLANIGFGMKEIAIIVAIIIVGIMVYTVLYIFVGTMIKSAEQIQFSQLPVAVIVLIGFMITVLCRQNMDSTISRICTYIPTFSPFLAVTKLFQANGPGKEFIGMGICTMIYLILGNILIVKVYKKENR